MTEADSPEIDPYKPFSSFSDWSGRAVDVGFVGEYADRLSVDKDKVTSEAWGRMLDTVNKWAAVDTGAIEDLYQVDRGFTYTVAATSAAWARIPQEKGEDVARVIADQLAGYEHVLDAATTRVDVSEYWIKGLHAVLCASQDTYKVYTDVGWRDRPFNAGAYKADPNNPLNIKSNRIHAYASPIDVIPEMSRLVDELRTPEFIEAEAIVQAAYVHYVFVCIHPFPDGNGRVSRALASIYLYRAYGVPLVIFADQKGRYLDSLEAADAGDALAFATFIRDSLVDTLNMVRTELLSAVGPSLDKQVGQLQALMTGRGGLPHAEVDDAGRRLGKLVAEAMDASITQAELPKALTARRAGVAFPVLDDDRYRELEATKVALVVDSAAPAAAQASVYFSIGTAKAETSGADFVIFSRVDDLTTHVFLREVHPAISEQLRRRVESVMGTALRLTVASAVNKAKAKLVQQGYL